MPKDFNLIKISKGIFLFFAILFFLNSCTLKKPISTNAIVNSNIVQNISATNYNGNINANLNIENNSNSRIPVFIDYSIKPAVIFNENDNEEIIFESDDPTRFNLSFGFDENYGQIISINEYTSYHDVALQNLKPGAVYYYKIDIFNEKGDYNDSFKSSFKAKNNSNEPFKFIVFGDNRPADGVKQPKIFYEIIDLAEKQNPDFVITTGDSVKMPNPPKNFDEVKTYWAGYTDATEKLRSKIPIFEVVGNHEEISNPDSLKRYRQIWLNPHNGDGEKNIFDETTYWFSYGNSIFIILNTEEPANQGEIAGAQLDWLKNILKYNYVNKFIFTHRPIAGSSRTKMKNQEILTKLFEDNQVTAVFSGHDHLYCYYKHNNVFYIITGGAGSPLYANLCLGQEIKDNHLISIDVNESRINGAVISSSGQTIDEFTWPIK